MNLHIRERQPLQSLRWICRLVREYFLPFLGSSIINEAPDARKVRSIGG